MSDLDNEELIATRTLNGLTSEIYEQSEADRILKTLGYAKIEKSDRIIYREKKGLLIPNAEITFYKSDRWVEANFKFDIQELKAINLKCKELGWIED